MFNFYDPRFPEYQSILIALPILEYHASLRPDSPHVFFQGLYHPRSRFNKRIEAVKARKQYLESLILGAASTSPEKRSSERGEAPR